MNKYLFKNWGAQTMQRLGNDFNEFTESRYRELIRLARENYRFVSYDCYKQPGKQVIWRHDIDLSVHRAVALARIEAEEGVKSTFFIHFHSLFYNLLEADVTKLVFEIIDMGHDIGLHFDPGYYEAQPSGLSVPVEERLSQERDWLQSITGRVIKTFSLHNPDIGLWQETLGLEKISGLVNASSLFIREHYEYCSDSNGYWRFKSLGDVLQSAQSERLHILTHPEWWTPEPMSPRDRISRCINERARSVHRRYDELITLAGRENIGVIGVENNGR